MRSTLMVGIVLFALIAVDSRSGVVAATVERSAPAGDAASMKSVGAWGIDLSDRDASIKAGDNFYMSQNGTWFARTNVGDNLPNAAYWRDLRRLAPMRVVALLEKSPSKKTSPPIPSLARRQRFIVPSWTKRRSRRAELRP